MPLSPTAQMILSALETDEGIQKELAKCRDIKNRVKGNLSTVEADLLVSLDLTCRASVFLWRCHGIQAELEDLLSVTRVLALELGPEHRQAPTHQQES